MFNMSSSGTARRKLHFWVLCLNAYIPAQIPIAPMKNALKSKNLSDIRIFLRPEFLLSMPMIQKRQKFQMKSTG